MNIKYLTLNKMPGIKKSQQKRAEDAATNSLFKKLQSGRKINLKRDQGIKKLEKTLEKKYGGGSCGGKKRK